MRKEWCPDFNSRKFHSLVGANHWSVYQVIRDLKLNTFHSYPVGDHKWRCIFVYGLRINILEKELCGKCIANDKLCLPIWLFLIILVNESELKVFKNLCVTLSFSAVHKHLEMFCTSEYKSMPILWNCKLNSLVCLILTSHIL